MAKTLREDNSGWRPISLDYLLSTYKLTSVKAFVPILIWVLIIVGSLYLTSQLLLMEWIQLSSGGINIINFFMFNPALVLGTMLLFWFGFEWGFIPVYLCTFIVALYTGMSVEWSLFLGLSFVLGLGIYALAYQSFPISYTLRSFQSVVFFIIISFVAAIASSLGSFIWSLFHNLSAAATLVIWKSWWSGIFLQLLVVNGPLLFIFSPAIERLKEKYMEMPKQPVVSSKWVYGSVISVTATLALFVYAGNLLGKMRIREAAGTGNMASLADVMEAVNTFELISWTSIGLIIITGYAAIFLLGSWNRELESEIKHRTRELEESEKELQRSLDEKKILLQEVHHRVKNNLAQVHAMLVLQENADSNPGSADLLKVSRARIRSMAMAHEALYQTENLSSIDMKEYLGRIIEAIHQSYIREDKRIVLRHDLLSFHMGMEKAIPLGLLINEIMINSYKHAFTQRAEGLIEVNMTNSNKSLTLSISDNGSGFDQGPDISKGKSLGMLLIRKFSRQLSAQVDISSSKDGGTVYKVVIPG